MQNGTPTNKAATQGKGDSAVFRAASSDFAESKWEQYEEHDGPIHFLSIQKRPLKKKKKKLSGPEKASRALNQPSAFHGCQYKLPLAHFPEKQSKQTNSSLSVFPQGYL